MSLRGGGSGLAWKFLAAGFSATALAAAAPGSPVGPAEWPARGPFGAFTWVAWFVSAALAATLLLLTPALPARRRSTVLGRAVPTALMFALLALVAFTAAASADQIMRSPAASLLLAISAFVVLRAVAARLDSVRSGRDRGADVLD